ncbi:hypothetical protein B7494_g698 [Chlorociboria aeruginascens]|nr:hypothetical protein B7494_g698 [Chlorociboria aeruginascens]
MAPSKKEEFVPYVPPQTGFVSWLPASWVPYAELMRLDRGAGFYAFYWHYVIGIAYAACIAEPAPALKDIAWMASYLALAVIVLRGFACTINDNFDQDFDRQVARCRNRPIARGAVSTINGHIFTAIQLAVGAAMMAPFPAECAPHAAILTFILGIYPLAKRVTNFPQVILGFGLAHPIFLCLAAWNVDPFRPDVVVPAVALYAACALWTITFDTIYAHQDIQDDIKAGVKSLAVLLGDNTKFACALLSIIQVALLYVTGVYSKFSEVYFLGTVVGTALSLTSMLVLVDLKSPASCAWWFGPGSRLVAFTTTAGLAAEYYKKTMA